MSVSPQKQVVITYPKTTPQSVLDTAKAAITAAGGVITHEFQLLRGFAAKASVETLDTLHTISKQYSPTIEEDQVVTAYGPS
ncbi:hypothetical protein MMC20_006147 [Loxospora ochrophaea]|nr:hypothetical protein [Loxospora ochrophaea]